MSNCRTQGDMCALATAERRELGLGDFDRLDPYLLAKEHGVPIYPIDELCQDEASREAVEHFTVRRPKVLSAALVPCRAGRFILENTAQDPLRRVSSIAHEMSHLL